MLSKKKKIEPELKTTPWGEKATSYLTKLLEQPYQPYQPTVQSPEARGYTPYVATPYPTGEVDVKRIIESPYYQGLKTQALTEEQEALNRLRRGSQLGGMLYSTPRLGAEAQLIGQTTSKLQTLLGQMAEQERQQNIARAYNEYVRTGNIAYNEHVRREAERLGMSDREYMEYLRQNPSALEKAGIATGLQAYAPWQYPMYVEEPTTFGQIMGMASPLISALLSNPQLFG
jgi:hypothetical protein